MKRNKGFTLIELLVVVLIIGILAAIAVPQYQKAVEKSRMSEAILAVEKIAQANEMYKLSTGNFTRNINDLDINMEGEDTNYLSSIPAKKSKNFMFASSNAVGSQYFIAVVIRTTATTRYSLAIDTKNNKFCNLYPQVSNTEEELCRNWATYTNDNR